MLSAAIISAIFLVFSTCHASTEHRYNSAGSNAHNPRDYIFGSRLIRLDKEELNDIYSLCHYNGSSNKQRGDTETIGAIEERIVGGVDAHVGEFPAAVGLRTHSMLPNAMERDTCGGTLVTWRHVVTTAVCIRDLEKSGGRIEVRIGGVCNSWSMGSCWGGADMEVFDYKCVCCIYHY